MVSWQSCWRDILRQCDEFVEEWNSVEVPSCRGSSQWINGCVDNKSGFGEEDDNNEAQGET